MTIALTFQPSTDTSPRVPGTRRRVFFSIALDSSYPTNGYSVAAADVGLVTIHSLIVGVTSTGKPVFWTGSKLKIFSAIGTEVSNAVDLSAETVIVEVIGI